MVFVRQMGKLNSDLAALLDEWASSLFRELDYRNEAANGVRFKELYDHMEVRAGGEQAWLLDASWPSPCITLT